MVAQTSLLTQITPVHQRRALRNGLEEGIDYEVIIFASKLLF